MKRPVREMPLYPTEAEIGRELFGSVRWSEWRAIAPILERKGLPQIDPLFGARYWPAVKAFLDRRNGLSTTPIPSTVDGKENWSSLERSAQKKGTIR